MIEWAFEFQDGVICAVIAKNRLIAATFVQNFYGNDRIRNILPRRFETKNGMVF